MKERYIPGSRPYNGFHLPMRICDLIHTEFYSLNRLPNTEFGSAYDAYTREEVSILLCMLFSI